MHIENFLLGSVGSGRNKDYGYFVIHIKPMKTAHYVKIT